MLCFCHKLLRNNAVRSAVTVYLFSIVSPNGIPVTNKLAEHDSHFVLLVSEQSSMIWGYPPLKCRRHLSCQVLLQYFSTCDEGTWCWGFTFLLIFYELCEFLNAWSHNIDHTLFIICKMIQIVLRTNFFRANIQLGRISKHLTLY